MNLPDPVVAMAPYFDSKAPLNELVSLRFLPGGDLTSGEDFAPYKIENARGPLVLSPFFQPDLRPWASFIRDLANSIIDSKSNFGRYAR